MHLCSHKNKNSARLEGGARLVKSGHSNGPAISHQNLHLSSDDDDDGDDDNDDDDDDGDDDDADADG